MEFAARKKEPAKHLFAYLCYYITLIVSGERGGFGRWRKLIEPKNLGIPNIRKDRRRRRGGGVSPANPAPACKAPRLN